MTWSLRRKRGTRPEEVTVPAQPPAPVRAYTKSGRVAHLLGADGHALCPPMAEWPAEVWLGDGSDEERERAAALPTCVGCKRAEGDAAS